MRCEDIRDQFVVMVTEGWESIPSDPVARHMETCEACRRELESLRETWAFLGRLPEANPGLAVRARLIGRVRWLAFRDALLSLEGWKTALFPAAVGVFLSIGLSILLPYSALVEFCRRAVGGLAPEPGTFLMAGLVYGLVPLAIATWLAERRGPGVSFVRGLEAALLFLVLVAPYVLVQCREFPAPGLAGFLTGMALGGFLGSLTTGWRWAGRQS